MRAFCLPVFELLERRNMLSAVATPLTGDVISSPVGSGPYVVTTAGKQFSGDLGSVNFEAPANLPLPVGQSSNGGETFYVAESNADPRCLIISVGVSWGDGGSGTVNLIANSNGGYEVYGTHTYATPGSYKISISEITYSGRNPNYVGPPVWLVFPDVMQELTIGTATALVDGPASTPDMTTNHTFNDTLGSVPYSPGAGLTPGTIIPPSFLNRVSIDWGDGSTSTATLVANDQGQLEILGTHTYVATGIYQVNISGDMYGTDSFIHTGPLSFSRTLIVTDTSVGLSNPFTTGQVGVFAPASSRVAPASAGTLFSTNHVSATNATSFLYGKNDALGSDTSILG